MRFELTISPTRHATLPANDSLSDSRFQIAVGVRICRGFRGNAALLFFFFFALCLFIPSFVQGSCLSCMLSATLFYFHTVVSTHFIFHFICPHFLTSLTVSLNCQPEPSTLTSHLFTYTFTLQKRSKSLPRTHIPLAHYPFSPAAHFRFTHESHSLG